MADSTGMTIEFLRARLLSERSISKTARDRADGLAKRVAELEQQLKHVTLQRKNAEKATSEVLAILESHGISDLSETYDSSSDQEEDDRESKEVNNVRKEEVNSTTSRPKIDKSSNSDPGFYPSIGRSLSWKGGSGNLENLEKTKGRRSSSVKSSGGSSPRHHSGKSCRQIKQRNLRPAEVEQKHGSNGLENIEGPLEHQTSEPSNSTDLGGNEGSPEMQKALEYQARLIDRFEAEENAQREWEEKFKENNCCSPDSIEHGNQSDITEEIDDSRADTSSETAQTVPLLAQQGNSGAKQAPNNHNPNPNQIPLTQVRAQEEGEPSSRSNESRKEKWLENNSYYSASHASSKGESSGNAIQVQHETRSDLGQVLQALQRAKQSIKQELDRSGGSRPADIPRDTGGLFRVPSTTSNSYMDSQVHMPSPRDPYMDKGMDLLSSSRLMYPSYIDLMPKTSSKDEFTRTYPNRIASEGRYTDYSDRLRLDMYKR
ncbi:hypothetical protein ACHQM5_012302 [Ranunculus cassubicifolius]